MAGKASRDNGRYRRKASRRRNTTFLIVCEGQTEESYFRHVNSLLHSVGVTVKSTRSTGSPEDIVRTASYYKDGDPKRGIDSDKYDEVWAVFDWDQRTEQVRKARAAAKLDGIHVALSNPSFEVWVIWHFAHYMSFGCLQRQMEKKLKEYWPEYVKGNTADFSRLPQKSTRSAIERATGAAIQHENDGRTFPEDRPSSELFTLINEIVNAWQKSRGNNGGSCPLL
jgi:hypothetical protein